MLNSTSGTLEELNIQGLQPGTLYVVRVVAINQFGAGESSKPMKVSVKVLKKYKILCLYLSFLIDKIVTFLKLVS